jgi:hypothetical protein
MGNHPDKLDTAEEKESSALMFIVESIGVYLGKIPVALQKNVNKALGHLFGVPIAYLDGVADELKAASAARVRLTEATGEKLAKSIKVDSQLAEIAAATHANKILRHQKNSIKVLKYAFEEIDSVPLQDRVEPKLSPGVEQVAPKEISEDWLNAFESEAINMSSEQMQRLFGKMLAGEILKPSSYSIRTVKLMGQMDSDVARLFQRFCSICITIEAAGNEIVDSRALTLGGQRSFGLHDFGLNFIDIGSLAEYGLLVEPNSSELPYGMTVPNCGANVFSPMKYVNKHYILEAIPPRHASEFINYSERGLALSRVGRELLSIVDVEENKLYTEALISNFEKKGLRFLEI